MGAFFVYKYLELKKDAFMREFIFGTSVKEHTASVGLLIFRLFIGLTIAFGHGLGKLPVSEQFVGMVGGMGFPAPAMFAWISALTEFGGGLLIALGLETRTASIFLTINMAVAALFFHASDPFQAKEVAFLFLFSFFLLCFTGGGKYALDRLVHR